MVSISTWQQWVWADEAGPADLGVVTGARAVAMVDSAAAPAAADPADLAVDPAVVALMAAQDPAAADLMAADLMAAQVTMDYRT